MTTKRLPSPPHNPGVRDLVEAKRAWSAPRARDEIRRGFLGWHENGYLPHRDEPGLVQFVTFRLADAFPAELRSEWEELLKIEDDRKRRIELEAYLDKGHGECHLRRSAVAKLVEGALLFRHGADYDLRAWVVMPNHVHLLVEIWQKPLVQLIKDWKGYTARRINRVLGRSGKLWQDDYWDRYIRDEAHYRKVVHYIEANPVKAGLVKTPEQWPFSSARFRDEYNRLNLPERLDSP